jgi:hypothetical protein
MDYSKLNATILPKVMDAIALINNPEIDPEIRQLNQEILFREVGSAVYAKIYDMNAFDMEIQHTTGPGIDDRYYGLAKVASASVSAGAVGLEEYVQNFLNNTAAKAQSDAMRVASTSGKHPTASRHITGPKSCQWCRDKQGDNVVDPPADFFHRHGGCDCIIITKGYRSRNGLLENYKPRKTAA